MEPRKHYFAKIPTIAIFIVMAMSGPLGVLLFILKGIDQKVQKEEQEAAAARGGRVPGLAAGTLPGRDPVGHLLPVRDAADGSAGPPDAALPPVGGARRPHRRLRPAAARPEAGGGQAVSRAQLLCDRGG